jgi:hypothetical protein
MDECAETARCHEEKEFAAIACLAVVPSRALRTS